MASFTAARSLLRSSTTVRSAASRFATASSKPKSNPFHLPKQSPLSSPRIFRAPVELGCCVSLMPFHTATASALLTSMLSATPQRFGWTPEDILAELESQGGRDDHYGQDLDSDC